MDSIIEIRQAKAVMATKISEAIREFERDTGTIKVRTIIINRRSITAKHRPDDFDDITIPIRIQA